MACHHVKQSAVRAGKAVGDDTENTWHQSYNDGMVMEQQVLYGMVFNKQTKMGSVDGEFGFNVTLSLVTNICTLSYGLM